MLESERQIAPYLIALSFAVMLIAGCGQQSELEQAAHKQTQQITQERSPASDSVDNKSPAQPSLSEIPTTHQQILALQSFHFNALLATSESLQQAINTFTKKREPEQLQVVQASWETTHNAYINTRLFRTWASNLNIPSPELAFEQNESELIHSNHVRIDQHPIIPGYLDSVTGYPLSGLIHSDIELTASSLNQEHQLGDKAYVALGFHALEFMLFGEKETQARSAEDFSPSAAEISVPHSAKRRRTQFISLLTTILVEDIRTLLKTWNGDKAYYPEAFETYSIDELIASLRQVSEVELEAVKHIQQALSDNSTQGIHDNAETLQTRKEIATKVLEILSQAPEPQSL